MLIPQYKFNLIYNKDVKLKILYLVIAKNSLN